jgi:8-oxo-dGTP pyrophosphatase MutT (NUDIX family)
MHDKPFYRRSARVFLVDGDDRLLLLLSGIYWITPGGGVADGEDVASAAAREMREEIGLTVDAATLGAPVAESGGYAEFDWASGEFYDSFFFHRVGKHDVDTSGMEDSEWSSHGGHHWWTVDELRTTDKIVYPLDVVPLLRELLAGRIPHEPVWLPWHH